MAGTLVSSLHRLKDSDNSDGGFFVFGDLSVKIEGVFKLQFTLYEVRDKEVEYITSILSEPFRVHPAKNWPGMAESTFLTRSFSDQGVRLRLRKEPRFRLNPRGPGSDNYEPRHYNTTRRRQSKQMEAANVQEGAQLPITPITPQSQMAIAGGSRTAKIEPPDTTGLGSIPSQAGGMYPMDNRKRGFSQTSQASLYGDESAAKRSRQEIEDASQLPFTGQPQFPGGQGMGYGAQQFADPFQVQQPLQMYQQHPQQPMQAFDQFSPTYMAPSPQQRMNRGDQQQQGYFSPRRAVEPFQPPSPYESPTSRLPQTTQFQRPPSQNAFHYNQPMQPPSMQAPYGMQPPLQQQQYAPQPDLLMQPMPPSRSPGNLGMYQQPGSELDPLLAPKGGDILASQGGMQPLPEMFYGGRQQGPGMQQVRTSQQMGPAGQQGMGGQQQMGPGGQQMGPGGQQGIPGQQQMGPGGPDMGTGLDLGER